MARLVGALDQGTSSTRFVVVDESGRIVASAQKEHTQHYPRPGWVEHDAMEILQCCAWCIFTACTQLKAGDKITALGITNQRETTVLFDARTGAPVHRAISWNCSRTQDVAGAFAAKNGGQDCLRPRTGLPVASYFSATKIRWLLTPALSGLEGLGGRVAKGEVIFGTMDTFLIWHLTSGAYHVTDVTNASRTLLCDLRTLTWDADLCELWGVDRKMLPTIEPSIGGDFGLVSNRAFGGAVLGCKITCVLGDQHAASFGQRCFDVGSCKSTFGTGAFVMLNTGAHVRPSRHGLLTTPLYQCKGHAPVYALEGAVAVAGSAIQWLRDNLELAPSAPAVGALAASVPDNGGVYFVPAFNGLFAPHWDASARGVLCGLTAYATKAHVARAAIYAPAFGLAELQAAFRADDAALVSINVDGGMAVNDDLVRFVADLCNVETRRPSDDGLESTALGACYGAGLASGLWQTLDDLRNLPVHLEKFIPSIDHKTRQHHLDHWAKAVHRAKGWAKPKEADDGRFSVLTMSPPLRIAALSAAAAFVAGLLLGLKCHHLARR